MSYFVSGYYTLNLMCSVIECDNNLDIAPYDTKTEAWKAARGMGWIVRPQLDITYYPEHAQGRKRRDTYAT